MKPIAQIVGEKPWAGWALFAATMIVVFVLGLVVASFVVRGVERYKTVTRVVPIGESEARSEVWGKTYTREYETWLQTADTSFRSKYGGGAMRDMLEEDPRWVVLWAGYAFSKDYNQGRGHYYAVEDIRNTLRTNSGMPGACWTCMSPDVPRLMREQKDIATFYKPTWATWGAEIFNPIGCLDCHDTKAPTLNISRPALVEAFERMDEDAMTAHLTQGDLADATRQEMRRLACAQCHVEYYFRGPDKYLTFPWDGGTSVEAMEAYYDTADFADWTHKLSRAKMLKAQHPDYELFMTGIHAQRGLACADCHMPYRAEGGVKYSSHKVQSPLNQISETCTVCHRESEEDLRQNVYERQDKIKEMLSTAVDAITRAHIEAKAAWDSGATEDEMAPILTLIRHAQWRCDFVAASHGAPFHSPIESARIVGSAIQRGQEARLQLVRVLAAHGVTGPVEMPDLSTKAKAQAYIGLDMEAERAKKESMQKTFQTWDEEAMERESKLPKAESR